MERARFTVWIDAYVRLWRTPGTGGLAQLFAEEATYLVSPWAERLRGVDAIATFWDEERAGPDERFDFQSELVAVDGDTAVARVSVDYLTTGERWRDLWIITLDADGRCRAFEEWPFAPFQRDGHAH